MAMFLPASTCKHCLRSSGLRTHAPWIGIVISAYPNNAGVFSFAPAGALPEGLSSPGAHARG